MSEFEKSIEAQLAGSMVTALKKRGDVLDQICLAIEDHDGDKGEYVRGLAASLGFAEQHLNRLDPARLSSELTAQLGCSVAETQIINKAIIDNTDVIYAYDA